MMLHPLTEIGIGMFVPVRISCSQLMMDVLGYSKRRQRQYKQDEAEQKARLRSGRVHSWRQASLTITRLVKTVKIRLIYNEIFHIFSISYDGSCRLFLNISLCCAHFDN